MSRFGFGNRPIVIFFDPLRRIGIRDSSTNTLDLLRRLSSLPESCFVSVEIFSLVVDSLTDTLFNNPADLAASVTIFILIGEF